MEVVEEVLGDATFLERYEVGAKLGEGGMGVVYRAVQRSLDRPVAIKFMHGALAESRSFQERFLAEAKLAASIIHTHVVAVFDRGVCRGVPFLVTEYVEGTPLTAILGGRPAEPQFALTLTRQILSGLQALHERGIVHRDLKPSNILVAKGPCAKVHDFGIAKPFGEAASAGREKTTAGLLVGTPHYMSPEQALGKELTPASDLYSLTVVLYEMVTGRLPFDAPSAIEILSMHLREPVQLPPGLPAPVAELLRLGLEKEPLARPNDAVRYAEALDRAAAALHAMPALPASQEAPRSLSRSAPTTLSRRPTPPPDREARPEAPQGAAPTEIYSVARTPYWIGALLVLLGCFALAIPLLRQPVRTLPTDSPPWMLRLEEVRDSARRGRVEDAVRTFFAVTRSLPRPEGESASVFATSPVVAHTDRTLLVLLESCIKRATQDPSSVGPVPAGTGGNAKAVFLALGLAVHDRDYNRIQKLCDDWLTWRQGHGGKDPDPDAASLAEVNAISWLYSASRFALADQPWQVVAAFGGLQDTLLSHAEGPLAFWSARLEWAALALAPSPDMAGWLGARTTEVEGLAKEQIADDGLAQLKAFVIEVRKTVEDRWKTPSSSQMAHVRSSLLLEFIIRRVSGFGWRYINSDQLATALRAAGAKPLADEIEQHSEWSFDVSNPAPDAVLVKISKALKVPDMGLAAMMK